MEGKPRRPRMEKKGKNFSRWRLYDEGGAADSLVEEMPPGTAPSRIRAPPPAAVGSLEDHDWMARSIDILSVNEHSC
jgi:hypothetical protein